MFACIQFESVNRVFGIMAFSEWVYSRVTQSGNVKFHRICTIGRDSKIKRRPMLNKKIYTHTYAYAFTWTHVCVFTANVVLFSICSAASALCATPQHFLHFNFIIGGGGIIIIIFVLSMGTQFVFVCRWYNVRRLMALIIGPQKIAITRCACFSFCFIMISHTLAIAVCTKCLTH